MPTTDKTRNSHAGKEQWGVEAQGLEASLLEFYNANSIAKLHVRNFQQINRRSTCWEVREGTGKGYNVSVITVGSTENDVAGQGNKKKTNELLSCSLWQDASKPSIDVGSTSEYGDSYICPPSLEGIRVDGPNRDDKISERSEGGCVIGGEHKSKLLGTYRDGQCLILKLFLANLCSNMVIGVARSQGGFHYVGNDKTRHERKTVASGITRAGVNGEYDAGYTGFGGENERSNPLSMHRHCRHLWDHSVRDEAEGDRGRNFHHLQNINFGPSLMVKFGDIMQTRTGRGCCCRFDRSVRLKSTSGGKVLEECSVPEDDFMMQPNSCLLDPKCTTLPSYYAKNTAR
uniref:Uncharacterized protein n=1 Tax=Ascaris lumbricoides TaxID=6252 RepID=A0A9J2PKS3_ASCLU